jgi:hypothetical protein
MRKPGRIIGNMRCLLRRRRWSSDDPGFVMFPDRNVDGEERWHTIGLVGGVLLLLVVHTFWDEDEEEMFGSSRLAR